MTKSDASSLLSLSIIVMAFNEAATIEGVVDDLDAVARCLGHPFEIVIVDDGSTDGTAEIADRLAAELGAVRVVHHETNLGIGDVLASGIKAARNEVFTVFPADGECPAEILQQFLPHMQDHDVVLGYIPERKNAWLSIMLSKAERLLLRMLFGPMPKFQGVFMYRRALLASMERVSSGRGWMIQMEWILHAQREGSRIISVPTQMRPRVSGKSKVTNVRSVVANLRQVLVLYWHLKRHNASRKESS